MEFESKDNTSDSRHSSKSSFLRVSLNEKEKSSSVRSSEEQNQQDEISDKIKSLIERNEFGVLTGDVKKLYNFWQNALKNEKELLAISEKMKQDQLVKEENFQSLQEKMKEHESTIENLQNKIRASCELVDAAHRREQLTQEELDSMREQVVKLGNELESIKKVTAEHETETGATAKNKEMLIKEKERLTAELLVARGKLAKLQKYQKDLEDKNEEMENRMKQLNDDFESLGMEHAQEKRIRANLNVELASKLVELDESNKAYEDLMNNFRSEQMKSEELESIRFENKNCIEKLTREQQELTASLKAARAENHQHLANISKLHQALAENTAEYKSKEDECAKLDLEMQKMDKSKESLLKKISVVEGQKHAIDKERVKLQHDQIILEKQLLELREQAGKDRKMIEALLREKDLMTLNAQKMSAFSQNQKNMINLQESNKKKLDMELEASQNKLAKVQKEYQLLVNEINSLRADLLEYKNKVSEKNETIKVKQHELDDCLKELYDTECQLKNTIKVFDQIRNERNRLSKTLIETNNQMKNIQNDLNIKSFEIEQLKEDITVKENMLVKGDFVLQKVTKEKESLKIEITNMTAEFNANKEHLLTANNDRRLLEKKIEQMESEADKMSKENAELAKENNHLSSQLLLRNEERKLLKEKIEILENILRRGEAQYSQRLDDIRLLKSEVKRTRQEKAILEKSVSNVADLRKELFRVEREYMRERLKCRSLEVELTRPLNVHRWRKLEGSDPTTYELMIKTRKLQKRLIDSSEAIVLGNTRLQEITKSYKELKEEVSRHPVAELSFQLHAARADARKKGIKIKAMNGERAMYEHQISEQKAIIQQKSQELDEWKKKYYILKKWKRPEKGSEDTLLPLLESMTSGRKSVGGGFKLSTSPPQNLPNIIS